MNGDRGNLSEQRNDSAEERWAFSLDLQEQEAPLGSFSLRFLLGVATLFAIVFAGIGTISGDWSSRQLLSCLGLIFLWSTLTGIIVFAFLRWIRDNRAKLGKMHYRSSVLANQGSFKKFIFFHSSGILLHLATSAPSWAAVICFLIWCAIATILAHFDILTQAARRESLFNTWHCWIQLVFFLGVAQVWSLYATLARPAMLELYAKGLCFSGGSKLLWIDITSTSWATDKPSTLVCKFKLKGGGGMIHEVDVPLAERLRVDETLRQYLGEKHRPLDESRRLARK